MNYRKFSIQISGAAIAQCLAGHPVAAFKITAHPRHTGPTAFFGIKTIFVSLIALASGVLQAMPAQNSDPGKKTDSAAPAPVKIDVRKAVVQETRPAAKEKPDSKPAAKVSDSVLLNINENALNIAVKNSQINAGIDASGADIRDSKLSNTNTGVSNRASNNSTINSGISVKKSSIQKSEITNRNIDVTNTAQSNSQVNSGIDADNAKIKNARITNSNKGGTASAQNNSIVNSGIAADNARIMDASVDNRQSGGVSSAREKSEANSGINLK